MVRNPELPASMTSISRPLWDTPERMEGAPRLRGRLDSLRRPGALGGGQDGPRWVWIQDLGKDKKREKQDK
jgi:hypothetical protein